MVNGIRASDLLGLNKGRSLPLVGIRVRQETPEEGRGTYQPKHYGCSNRYEDNSPKMIKKTVVVSFSKPLRDRGEVVFDFPICSKVKVIA